MKSDTFIVVDDPLGYVVPSAMVRIIRGSPITGEPDDIVAYRIGTAPDMPRIEEPPKLFENRAARRKAASERRHAR